MAPAKEDQPSRKAGKDSPAWQKQFVDEHAKNTGQAGGQPIEGRGPAQSTGGAEHEESEVGNTNDLSPRGGVGIRETEKKLQDKP